MTSSNYEFSPFVYNPVSTPEALPSVWKQWVAENKLLCIPDSTISQTLLSQGFAAATIQQELRLVQDHPYLRAGENFVQALKKLESYLTIRQQLAQLSPTVDQIDRRSNLSRADFLQQYYATNTPVILTGLMNNWAALTRWTPDYFKTHYGAAKIEVQTNRNADRLYERKLDQHRQLMTLAEYVDLVMSGQETNDYYMVANNHNLERKDLKGLLNDVEIFPEYLDKTERSGRIFFWFGPAGTVTPLHHDPVNVMLAQVKGRKVVRMISPYQTPLMYNYQGVFSEVDCDNPDYDRYPLFRQVHMLEFVLEPEEVLFIPVGWWHWIKALEVSLSLSFTNFVYPNRYQWNYPTLKR